MKVPGATEYLLSATLLKYKTFGGIERPYNLNIVGWRNHSSRPNYFDDVLAVYWQDGNNWLEKTWPITTYPGLPWLLNPMSPKGAAILVPGQYVEAYQLGRYHDASALKQVRPVRVYRDKNLDGHFDLKPDTIEEGLFGLHLHRAGLWSKLVGISSAGCQVFQKREDFNEFIKLCEKAAFHWGNTFTYTLMGAL